MGRNMGTNAQRRFDHYGAKPDAIIALPADHAAVRTARTIFPSTVTTPAQSPRLLVSGINQRKIGDRVTKGAWAGMPIFCLTLEERATCPATCHHWRSCYGNGMHWSRRHAHGADLEFLLQQELVEKQSAHPAGFVVRLHILGDFYDAAYVALWSRWMQTFPALHVFGFTAREEFSDEGILIRMLNQDYPARWVIRFSTPAARAIPGARYAITAWQAPDGPTLAGAVVCPAQTGRTACCGTCAFCWTGTKPVAFIAHGKHGIKSGYTRRVQGPEPEAEPDLTTPPRTLPTRQPVARRPAVRSVTHAQLAKSSQSKPPEANPSQNTHPANTPRAPAPAAPEALDRSHTVPIRPVELRAWMYRARLNPGSFPHAAQQLIAANHYRAQHGLPPFRLIPTSARDDAESIMSESELIP